jgi:indolepyruvate ferredoxin oxidoreductase
MEQRRLDRSRGYNTAGLISGYRGSPLGAYDQQLWRAADALAEHDIAFQPGINEDLAATALWGAQMHKAFGASRVDGVFGIWYGKGNGVDRTGDVFRNANMLGTSPLGGVLAIGGDDHAAQSSMFPHQTDGIFQSVNMPVIQPASVPEILSLGIAGIALSRFSGLWVAMKTIAEVVESAASFRLSGPVANFVAPEQLVPAHGLNWDAGVAWPSQRAEYERRMVEERLPAAVGWAIANRIDRPMFGSKSPRLCIVTVGKAHQDLMQALVDLGIDDARAEALGIGVYKVAMSWPLASAPLAQFAAGAEEIFVVEEKYPVVEDQIKTALFNRSGRRPRISGKTDSDGAPLLPVIMEFTPLMVADALIGRLPVPERDDFSSRLSELKARRGAGASIARFAARKPFFCSGCPHNRSTRTPEGSIAGGGIGCHVMALSQPRLKTTTFSQMGGEGVQWLGAAPFSETEHIFQNIGDGTYQHSGLLAVRAAIAAGTNITFKILYNDAVAMTGGQPAEGSLSPQRIVAQLLAEGVGDVRLVSDDPDKWRDAADLPAITIHHRDELDAVQRALRDTAGVTAIVYEQTCAAEKRRRRKRGQFPDPDRRIFINPRVCEGCGDCSVQSNCMAIEPLETEFGRKRRVNQSSCNKDFSCTNGFCPSFVEVEGARLRKPDEARIAAHEADLFPTLPQPEIAAVAHDYNIYIAGIGGLGVLTVGALLGSAAHLNGMSASVLDFTGLSQKNGAVVSQVRLAPAGHPIHAVRIGQGEVDLLIGTDLVVAAAAETLGRLTRDRSAVVLNIDEAPTADVVDDRDAQLATGDMIEAVLSRASGGGHSLPATRIAEGLFGNNVAANTLMLGYAWQKGLVPIPAAALLDAIAANGAAVALNRRAFHWGRLAATDLSTVETIAGIKATPLATEPLETLVLRRIADLTAYQNEAYAERYRALVARVKAAALPFGVAGEALVAAVAVNAYKLMAYKDEYEVARLYSEPAFREAVGEQFGATGKLSIWLAPPILSKTDPHTGRPAKRKFGSWIFPAFRVLAAMRGLRGSWADPFGRTTERRTERALIEQYYSDIERLLPSLDGHNLGELIELCTLPASIRGYGPVKEQAMSDAATDRTRILALIDRPRAALAA